ncbi:uncharacterized protein BJ212DRAFT_1303892 [Suillus subaureus]|uniref:Uncharacterized protein n=1 Tax=Suillus subaureus TaxID=48587 RepID=A0A9P7J6Z3_9AGAM|nr:uncharacterized protein BJ212DRAFT_1303892 [Suillus subaureus]KAG1805827.1 hypothetical protein BJ212DRAFT_1303892 [Suillus subaureus]
MVPKGGTHLWFQDTTLTVSGTLSSICVPATVQYTKERGYDIRPGDIVNVLCGPEYQRKGVMTNVDFPNGRLTLISDIDFSLISVQIKFMEKIHNINLDSFKTDIGQEVFIIGGDWKGYGIRLNGAILKGPELASFCEMHHKSYLAPPPQSTTPPVEKVPTSSSVSIADLIPSSSNVWSSWSASIDNIDMVHDPVNPISSTSNPWAVNLQDSINNIHENSQDMGSLPWLMTKEFASTFLTYHAVLKVSLSFLGGRLYKRFVLTACPDPFCGDNGPAPEGCITAFCTSNSAGAQIVHYHIPSKDLSQLLHARNSKKSLFWMEIITGIS